MSRNRLEPPLVARNANALKVLGIARISGAPGQSEKSNEDQGALYQEFVAAHCEIPFTLKLIAGKGSGERLDRAEVEQAQAELETGEYDLIIAEDLGRIMRRIHAFLFCEAAEDIGTRVIALNDHVDTGQEGWRLNAFFASMRHEMYNADTAKRIRRTQRNRFANGGMVKTPLFCYIKPPGCKNDSDLQKNLELEWVVLGIFDRLELGWSYCRIADWLNDNKVPLGPGCRRNTWNGAMVRRFVFNEILKGQRVWNEKKSVRVNKHGTRKTVKAPPEDRLNRDVPHLAFIDSDRYDRLVARLIKEGEQYSVPKRRKTDPRKGRSKKRTRFPGQLTYCECGEMFVFGGHGQTDHLMCNGARAYTCWRGITFDATLASKRISQVIFEFLSQLPGFDPAVLALLHEEAAQRQTSRHQRLRDVERDFERMAREEQRLVDAIKRGDAMDSLLVALKDLQNGKRSLEYERKQLQKELPPLIELPDICQIRRDVCEALRDLAFDSLDFGDCMRQMIPKIIVYPVRLCDGGLPVLRARFEIDLASYLPESFQLPSLVSQLRCERVVDLFDMPQRAAYREQVVALRAKGLTEREVARRLNLTITATQRAAQLHRLMQQLGLTDPYIRLLEPPSDYTRLSRHRHKRYRPRSDDQDEAA